MPNENVRIIYPAIGGAFGGREDMSVQILLALAAWKLQSPVRIIWSRQESMIGHGKRHATVIRAKWGATKDGRVVAIENEIIGDGGAYMYTSNKVLGNSTITSTGPYFIPNVKTDVYGVYTNNLPGAAFRGFGAPQALFMAEMQMDKLAEKLGMDPVEFRLKNALRDGDTMGVGTPSPSPVSVVQCIEAAQSGLGGIGKTMDFRMDRHRPPSHRPRPRLCCRVQEYWLFVWLPGELLGKDRDPRQSEIDRVVLHHAGAEVGQGTHTVMVQMAAEAVGVPFEKVKIIASDSATMENSGSVSASRMTFMSGNAIRGAAEVALKNGKPRNVPPLVSSNTWRRAPTSSTRRPATPPPTLPTPSWPRPPKWKWTPRPVTCA
jgi:CO/xanthine dehydrogenase Mo-binding subunit